MRQKRDEQTGETIYYSLCDSCECEFDEGDMSYVNARLLCKTCEELPEDDEPDDDRKGGTLEQIR